ncbi:MAG: GAF domain-containing protein [Chitinispirillaceae bacterium]|nr:GAF domain-containing protein [Chitinispirillaceae bacterium]
MAIVHGFAGKALLRFPIGDAGIEVIKIYYLSALLMLFGMLESIRIFFRPIATKTVFLTDSVEKKSLFFSLFPWRVLVVVSAVIIVFLPDPKPVLLPDLTAGYVLSRFHMIVLYLRLILCLGILFSIENIYRYAQPRHRRMARISFIAFALCAIFDGVFTIRLLLFSYLDPHYLQASIILYGVCITTGLFGFLHYRIMDQKVVISRAGIYSSMTLILAGMLLLLLGATAAFVQRAGMRFSYFEEFLVVFSILSFLIIGASSKWVRLRIAGFINRHFYRSKYDYRDQFFRLHHTYMAGSQLSDSINLLLENLTYTLGIGETFVFLRHAVSGHFCLHHDPDQADQDQTVIKADSPLVSVFHDGDSPCFFPDNSYDRREMAKNEPLIGKMGLNAVFPIKNNNELVGLLSIKKPSNKNLDKEDQEIIKVFAVSIGNVYTAYQMLQERSELKQFESLHHITSFIIHDIKNQVATLTLLSKNARTNMANPEFQQSLLRSIQGCAANLQALVDKLSMPVNRAVSEVQKEDINNIVQSSLESTGARSLPLLRIETFFNATGTVPIDRRSLLYVLDNLIKNAIEAMNENGTLTIETGDCEHLSTATREEVGLSERQLGGKHVFVLVRDTGTGMDSEFMQQNLFHPFSSTKDKGIGIGLYQSKTLVERMGGYLLCVSRLGVGTTFCCIL